MQTARELLAQPFLAAPGADLDAAARVTYVLHQRFSYAYDGPVRDLDHRLVVVPRQQHGAARRRLHSVAVCSSSSPWVAEQARTRWSRDAAGNPVVRARVAHVPADVAFEVAVVVERTGPVTPARLPAAAARDRRWLQPTRRTAPDEALRAMAAQCRADTGSDEPLELAEAVCARVHAAIAYDYGPTGVRTTAAEALAGGRGVCQDHAHVMLAVCRTLGIAARYVSGHLLGEGGTHAWVEVVVPARTGDAAQAVAFDPCNNRRAGGGYLTVAVGRDYADVAPTSGTYSGSAAGRLTTLKRLGVTALAA